jgi:hypothetical protein
VSGSPSYYLAQLSPDSIERLPYLIVMEIETFAAASALQSHLTAYPAQRRAALVAAMRAANDTYIASVGGEFGQAHNADWPYRETADELSDAHIVATPS